MTTEPADSGTSAAGSEQTSTEKTGPPARGYSTRTIMSAAAVGVVFGLLFIPANLYALAITTTYPLLGAVVWGLWAMPAFVAVGLQRRFGVGILACAVSGLLSGPLTGYGLSLLALMLLWGLLVELPFLVTRYRRFSVTVFLASGAFVGVVAAAMGWAPMGMEQMSPGTAALVIGAAIGSNIVAALLSVLAVGRLAAAGIGAVPRGQG